LILPAPLEGASVTHLNNIRSFPPDEVAVDYLTYLCAPLIEQLRKVNGIDMPPEPRMSEHEFNELCRAYGLEKQRTKPARVRKPRRPTLASVAAQASKAALEVARYEVRPDGTVVVVTGKSESTEASNPWLDDLKATKQ
jgi:hypothetical protein